MDLRGMRRLRDAVTLQAALDYIKGRRKLDRRKDFRTEQTVREAEAFFRSESVTVGAGKSWSSLPCRSCMMSCRRSSVFITS